MQFGAADAIDLGTAFRAGPENDSAAALVETGGGILDLTLSLTLYTIAFHLKPPNSNGLLESISSFFYQYTRKILSLITHLMSKEEVAQFKPRLFLLITTTTKSI